MEEIKEKVRELLDNKEESEKAIKENPYYSEVTMMEKLDIINKRFKVDLLKLMQV